jgi:ABC-type Zn uptake system ZnuABC Zn-binding protein ZnuA
MDSSGALRCAITIAKWVLASRNPNMINLPKLEEKQVAPRQIRKLVKYKSDNATDEIFPQLKQTESGRYLIQVDKQTKASYETAEAAQSAALEIKKGHPIVRVSIFDSVEHSSRLVELLS